MTSDNDCTQTDKRLPILSKGEEVTKLEADIRRCFNASVLLNQPWKTIELPIPVYPDYWVILRCDFDLASSRLRVDADGVIVAYVHEGKVSGLLGIFELFRGEVDKRIESLCAYANTTAAACAEALEELG